MSTSILLNLDSKDGTFIADSTFTALQAGANPHIVNHTLIRPLQNVSKISLKSVELPITADNCRASNNTLRFAVRQVTGGTGSASVTLTNANYTSITDLLTAMNAQFASQPLPCGSPVVMTYGLVNGLYKVSATCANSTGAYTIGVLRSTTIETQFRLTDVLGFTGQETAANLSVSATFGVNLNYDNYYNLLIYSNSLNFSSVNNTAVASTFKIPINAIKGTILFWNDQSGFKQSRDVGWLGVLNNLTVQITDKWGYDLPCLAQFSLTLELECDSF